MAKKKIDIAICILLLIIAGSLRFVNLGYSEYQDDEKKAFYRPTPNQDMVDFFLAQRKGPMQFIVSGIPYLITHDFRNELAERFPFTFLNTLSVGVLYFLLLKLFKNRVAAIFGCILYLTNGFVVGFSRIAQYQNLNLFFSFLALYFYANLVDKPKNLYRSSLLGTIMVSLSLLSHWDTVFYTVPLLYFIIRFLQRDDISKKYKTNIIKLNILLGSVILLPFLVPYGVKQIQNTANLEYFGRRLGFGMPDINFHSFVFHLYNPFFTLPLFVGLLFLSIFFIKDIYVHFLWFLTNLLAILFFMINPGTHIYNYSIPIIFLAAGTGAQIFTRLPKALVVFAVFCIVVIGGILYYQTYMLFVDHSKEYPWESKMLFGKATTPYVRKEVATFGFPHYRNWKGVNAFIQSQNTDCTYVSNEGKEISQFYMDIPHGQLDRCFYIVSIKRPFISTRDGIVFADAYKKPVIYSYTKDGEAVTKVYKKEVSTNR